MATTGSAAVRGCSKSPCSCGLSMILLSSPARCRGWSGGIRRGPFLYRILIKDRVDRRVAFAVFHRLIGQRLSGIAGIVHKDVLSLQSLQFFEREVISKKEKARNQRAHNDRA